MKAFDISKSLLVSFSPFEGRCFFLSFENYEDDLKSELNLNKKCKIIKTMGRLFLVEGWIRPALWAQSHWLHPEVTNIASIGEAAKFLKSTFPRWSLFSVDAHRRSQLIWEKLPRVTSPQIEFLQDWNRKDHGAWTLEDSNTLWYSTHVIPALPIGEFNFKEDKVNPPSRAYNKLWELFTLHGYRPNKGEKVLDMGSCPGGWTWVLQGVGCQVISVDKAPIDPKIESLPRVRYLKRDAFALDPKDVGPIDCFFSDIICYPEKLLELVQKWRLSGFCHRFVCTIKFRGKTDFETLQKFADIPSSKLIHLSVNKHEVTWICGFDNKEN
ncbi:MAG: hypothetical protein RJB66_465 [Pseudomonadota bacterium]|jgi:23S rRNA (cytidine2498-2'-O)-methyltransferase